VDSDQADGNKADVLTNRKRRHGGEIPSLAESETSRLRVGDDGHPGRTASSRARHRWWRDFVLILVVGSVWALALPLLSGADEESHAVRAAAMVRGDVIGRTAPGDPDSKLFRDVEAPEAYRDARDMNCVVRNVSVLPKCQPKFDGGSRLVDVPTYQYRQPPAYYAVVGLPTLLFPARIGAYLMRLMGVALSAAFLASAFASARELRRPALFAALLLAISPEVVFLMSTVTPNGLEATTAICLWTTLLVIARGTRPPDGRMVARAAVALIVLVNVRGLSPLFAFVCLVAVAFLAGRPRIRELFARTDVRRWTVAAAISSVPALAWIAFVSVNWKVTRSGNGLMTSIDSTPKFLRQTVGVFVWEQRGFVAVQEILPPIGFYLLWWAAVALVLVAAFRFARRNDGVVLGLLIALFLWLPISVDGLNLPSTGYFWEGRHGLPLYAGVVLVAGLLAAGAPDRIGTRVIPWRRVWATVAGVVVAAQAFALVTVLRRFGVGGNGPWNPVDFLFLPDWSPGLPAWLALLLLTGAMAALAWTSMHETETGAPVVASAPERVPVAARRD
jgi:hypothetical protein